MKIVNATPHDIKLNDGTVFPASGQVARVSVNQVDDGDINGIPVKKNTYGEVEGIPEPRDGVVYIVSAMVVGNSDRTDLVAPDTGNALRNDQGHIVSVPGFVR